MLTAANKRNSKIIATVVELDNKSNAYFRNILYSEICTHSGMLESKNH